MPSSNDPATSALSFNEPEPLFSLLGMAVRVLMLNQGALKFSERPDGGTLVQGRLFDMFDLDGLVYLDPAHPRGEVRVRFGCPVAADGSDESNRRPATAAGAGMRAQACDLIVGRLLPDLRQLGDVSAYTSGILTVRFGDDPRSLFAGATTVASAGPTCPQLSSRPIHEVLGLPLAATLRLGRTLLEVRAVHEHS